MKNKIFTKSDNQELLEKAFIAPLNSYYFGQENCIYTIVELFDYIKSQSNFNSICEEKWPEKLLSIQIDISNLSDTMIKFWSCIFGIVCDSSYLGENYRKFADSAYFRIFRTKSNEILDCPFILEDWEPTKEDCEFIFSLILKD